MAPKSSILSLSLIKFVDASCRRKLYTWLLKMEDRVTRGIFAVASPSHSISHYDIGLLGLKILLRRKMSAINEKATRPKLKTCSWLRRGVLTGMFVLFLILWLFSTLLTSCQKDGGFCHCKGRACLRWWLIFPVSIQGFKGQRKETSTNDHPSRNK